MNIDVRKFAPKQVESVNAEELTEALEQFKSVSAQVKAAEIKLKELKEQEKYISEHTIPDIMEKMNLSTLKLKDGSELAVKKVYSATIKADKKVEPQTLRVTMEDWKNKGNDVPKDLFWTFEGNRTKVK